MAARLKERYEKEIRPTLVKEFGVHDRKVTAIARAVHDADLLEHDEVAVDRALRQAVAGVEHLVAPPERLEDTLAQHPGVAGAEAADLAHEHAAYLLDAAAASGGRLIPFVPVAEAGPALEDTLARLLRFGARGLRLLGELRGHPRDLVGAEHRTAGRR